MRNVLLFATVFWLTTHVCAVRAGSVLTDNLPAGTSIVNIDAQEDGASRYDGGVSLQAYWYSPFSTVGTLLTLPVSPGTYTFDITDPANASAEFPSLSQTERDSIYTAWTYNTPWITQFFVFDISAVMNPKEPQLFDGAGGTASYDDAQSAFDAAVAGNYTNQLRLTSEQPLTGPPGREGNVFETSYTVTKATSLVFVIPDYDLGDNHGGVSVVVTQIVPEPGVGALLVGAGGLTGLGWLGRRARRPRRHAWL